jgi:hypothetical protein
MSGIHAVIVRTTDLPLNILIVLGSGVSRSIASFEEYFFAAKKPIVKLIRYCEACP